MMRILHQVQGIVIRTALLLETTMLQYTKKELGGISQLF